MGFFVCFLLLGCSGLSFYRYYGMQAVAFNQGKLLGPTEKEDLPFANCQPNRETQFPCVVMVSKDFFALKQDYLDLKQRLKDCEKI